MSLLFVLRSPAAGGESGTAMPTGVQAASAIGSVIVTGAAVHAPSGMQATSTLGSVVGSGEALHVASGVDSTSAVGEAVESGEAGIDASGIAAASALGDVVAGVSGLVEVEGLETSGAIGGVVELTGEALHALVGLAALAAIGTVLADGGAEEAPAPADVVLFFPAYVGPTAMLQPRKPAPKRRPKRRKKTTTDPLESFVLGLLELEDVA